jgi:hypothetical protein
MQYARVNDKDEPIELIERDPIDVSLVRKHANGIPVIRVATSADKKWIADNGGDAPDLAPPGGMPTPDIDTPGQQTKPFTRGISSVFRKLLDRIRELEGKPPITDTQYDIWEQDAAATYRGVE